MLQRRCVKGRSSVRVLLCEFCGFGRPERFVKRRAGSRTASVFLPSKQQLAIYNRRDQLNHRIFESARAIVCWATRGGHGEIARSVQSRKQQAFYVLRRPRPILSGPHHDELPLSLHRVQCDGEQHGARQQNREEKQGQKPTV